MTVEIPDTDLGAIIVGHEKGEELFKFFIEDKGVNCAEILAHLIANPNMFIKVVSLLLAYHVVVKDWLSTLPPDLKSEVRTRFLVEFKENA